MPSASTQSKAVLAAKPCGETRCPLQMRDLWAKAHLACAKFDEFMLHPTDPALRAKVADHMTQLRAAAKLAEPVMEVRLSPGPH